MDAHYGLIPARNFVGAKFNYWAEILDFFVVTCKFVYAGMVGGEQ